MNVLELKFRHHRCADEDVKHQKEREPGEVGESKDATHNAAHNRQELENSVVHPGVVRELLGVEEGELLFACGFGMGGFLFWFLWHRDDRVDG